MSNLKHFLKRSVAVLLCAGMLSSSALAVESPNNDDGSHFEVGQIDVEPFVTESPDVEPLVTESPDVEPPVTESPDVEPPVTESPDVEPPVTESSDVEPPVTESPNVEPPVTESPDVEPPVTESPDVEPPVTESPDVEPPVTESPDMELSATQSPDAEMLLESRFPQLSRYYFTEVVGYVFKGMGIDGRPEFKKQPVQVRNREGRENSVDGLFDLNEPFEVTYYKYGIGVSLGVELSNQYTVDSTSPFDCEYNSYGDAVGYKCTETITVTDPSLSEITLVSRACADKPNADELEKFHKHLHIQFYDERRDGPASARIIVDPSNSDQYLLTGVDSTMEYRRNTSQKWTPCAGNQVVLPIPNSDQTIDVRYKATENQAESKFITLELKERTFAPSVSINWFDESFKGLTEDMEIAVGDGLYQHVTSQMIHAGATPYIDQATSGSLTISVRRQATDTTLASAAKTITIYPRAPQPSTLSLNSNTYVVSGTSTSMQYRGPNDTAWQRISGTSVNLSSYAQANQTVKMSFRTKSSSTTSYSKPVTIILPRLSAAPMGLSLDFAAEKITGFTSNTTYQYRVGTGSWSTMKLSNLTYSVSSLISSSTDKQLSIRIAGSDSSQLSNVWSVTLPHRPAAPETCMFIYNDSRYPNQAVLKNVSSAMEYKIGTNGAWTGLSGSQLVLSLPTAKKTYYIRTRATSHAFASVNKSCILYAPAAAPSGTLNRTKETITVSDKMEYSVDGGSYIRVSTGTTSLSITQYIDSLSGSNTHTISLRYFVTEAKPASKVVTKTITARRAAPTTLTYSSVDHKITGATTSMRYREVGTETWKKVTAKSFSVDSLLQDRNSVTLEFQYAPTSSNYASDSVSIRCYR